jgi:hypothetical protein
MVVCCAGELAGRNVDGAAWRETWSERLMYASNNLDTVVERNAHKWAADPSVSVLRTDAAWLYTVVAACIVCQEHQDHSAQTLPCTATADPKILVGNALLVSC